MANTDFDDSEDFGDTNFDPNDEVSYYYGNLARDDVKDILNDSSIGTFLIRDSTKDEGQKVLCVKEAPKCINNYKIINKTVNNSNVYYLYGKEDCLFDSIPKILEFYSTHYLNQSPLVKPAFHHKKVVCSFDFDESEDPNEDLYFKEGDLLTILEYTQGESWWKAMNQSGKVGLIPTTLIRRLKPNEPIPARNSAKESDKPKEKIEVKVSQQKEDVQSNNSDEAESNKPFNVRVIEDYTPSPYEKGYIALRKGQVVRVLEMKSEGKWFGQVVGNDDKKGLFPFNRVEMLDE